MTMLSNSPGYPQASRRHSSRGSPSRLLILRFRRLLNLLVAAALARYERHAASATLRHLSDRELKDIGLFRYQIGEALDDAAKTRARLQAGGR